MRGIDVASWQTSLDLNNAFKAGCEFVIVKLTQGTAYKNPARMKHVTQIANAGKLLGCYHYANGNNPEQEAQHFYNTGKAYWGNAVPALDFEINIDTATYGNNRQWCERFIARFHTLSGVWPLLYIDSRYLSQFKGSWIVAKCGLWLARYPINRTTWTDDNPPSCAPWKQVTIWQFTSSLRIAGYNANLDGNLAYLTRDAWLKIAKAGKATSTPESAKPAKTTAKKPTAQVVSMIVAGKYGTGAKRKEALKNAGYNPSECQKLVNKYYEIAHKVIKGKYGNGQARKNALEKDGYNYAVVQQIVNMIV